MENGAELPLGLVVLRSRLLPVLELLLPDRPEDRNDRSLMRWLKANDGCIDEASKAMMKYVEWRNTKPQYGMPDGVAGLTQECVQWSVDTGKAVLLDSADQDGRAVVVVRVCRHDPQAAGYCIERLTRFAVWLVERAISRGGGDGSCLLIFDLAGVRRGNIDLKAVRRILFLFSAIYPERLGRCIVLRAPSLFGATWQLIKPWLQPRTVAKVCFVDRQSGLTNFLDPAVLKGVISDDIVGDAVVNVKSMPTTQTLDSS